MKKSFKFLSVILSVICLVMLYLNVHIVLAEEPLNMDLSTIEADLPDLNEATYPKDLNGTAQIISFQEYCYSTRPAYKDLFGIYVYVYNPAEKEISIKGDSNLLNMALSYNSSGKPASYGNVKLVFLNKTENNRFYKFKIADSLLESKQAYAKKYDGLRRYDVAGIQLVFNDNSEISTIDNTVGTTYLYTGYAHGCGPDYEADSTLNCFKETFETISLEVHPTAYRPAGTNGKNDYTQDSLHSVYFKIPNRYLDCGSLYSVHASWLNAVIKPALVTGNQEAYAAVSDHLGNVVTDEIDQANYLEYCFMDEGNYSSLANTTFYNLGYNVPEHSAIKYLFNSTFANPKLDTMYLLFNSGNAVDSADSFIVSSDSIISKAKAITPFLDRNPTLLGKYSKKIFESIDDKKTEVNYTTDTNFNMSSISYTQNFFQKLIGTKTYTDMSNKFKNISAIKQVANSDLSGTPQEISDNLLVSSADVSSLQSFYNSCQNETVYLFRYQISDYIAIEANTIKRNSLGMWNKVDSNSYFFQETVNLDFEIIDFTFKNEETLTVIPAVCSPVDFFPGATPPLYTKSDKNIFNSLPWNLILGIAGLLLLLAVFIPLVLRIVSFFNTAEIKKGIKNLNKKRKR